MRRFLASALAVALTLLAAEGLMVYISAHPDTTCGLTMAATPSTLVDTFVRADQTGWGISHSTGGIGACAWGGDADGTNANVTLKGHLGVVTNNSATASATATLSDGAARAGGDALVKVMASATDSGEIGPVLNYSDVNGGSYYEADFETHLNRLQFSFAKNGAITYPGETYSIAAKPQTFYWIRLHVSGTRVKTVSARIWQDGAPEPADWALTVTDTAPLGDGVAGIHTSWQYARPGEALSVAAFGYSPTATAVIPTAPTVRSFSPATGQYGDVITLTGTGFTGASGVRFNGVVALTYNVISDTTMVARVPNVGAQTGPISVSNSVNTGWSLTRFAITDAAGPVYWVSPTGNDANSGDYAHPFATITRADGVATAGASIHVQPGDYALTATLITSANGAAAAPIRYISDTLSGARLDLRSATDRSVWRIDGNYQQVIGFDVTASGALAVVGLIAYGHDDLIARNAVHDIYRESCHDAAVGGAGITVVSPNTYAVTSRTVVDGNTVERIGASLRASACQNLVHGIYIATSGNTVTNNIVRNVVGYGIHLYHDPNHNLVANNDIDHSGEGGIVLGADTQSDGGVEHTAMYNIIANNISRDNGLNGSGSAGYGIWEYTTEGPTDHNSYLNNDLFHNPAGAHNPYVSGDTDRGQISSDPLYVNYAAHDYHLRPDSPAKNAGVALNALTHDFDQALRPQGRAPDIGAYEAPA